MSRAVAGSLFHKLCLLALASCLFAHFPTASNARVNADGPEVSIGATKRDYGDVFAGEELEQNFPVRNLGNKPLELEQKSALGMRSTTHGHLTAALWRPNNILPARTVANRAAPS